ncbi:DUF1697 domain-containing protein [Novipirellula sp.]|uniref:DUF1697 domain-containing protein n=1 Tax=Novipirellula sp. TaxID=2795430 RepID=UPI00356B3762
MPDWIALIRGINVGGHNKMPMVELRTTLESAGCCSVRTYIQSGNVVFTSANRSKRKLAKHLGDAIEEHFGFRPAILLLSEDDFRTAVASNPFLDAIAAAQTLHFFFLDSAPCVPDLDALAKLATASERFELVDTVFYLHSPDGIGRSKLAAGLERKLGVPTTARNFRTIQALSDIFDDA